MRVLVNKRVQYQGTWVTIKATLGCSEKKAKEIEENYHKLYSGLKEFADSNVYFARENGYVNCAFGLKVRTPLLATGIASSASEQEGRSANNATTQSWGMLMNRALIEFREIVEASQYRHKIRFCNTIHDAGYFMIKNEPNVIKFVNDNLIKCMQWQEHPSIVSDLVKLGAELDIGKSWDKMYTIKNGMSYDNIVNFLKEKELYVDS